MICDFCREKETDNVYATDYAPVSLCYCDNCREIHNIRPREIAIFGWARLGELYFKPYIWNGVEYPPMVYSEGKYMTVKELIESLTEEKIREWIKPSFRLEMILKKFNAEVV